MMTCYRLALYDRQLNVWTWNTTALNSLQAVFQLLRNYSALPQNRIRVFTAASKEKLDEMLKYENTNQVSGSVTAAQFLQARLLHVPEQSATQRTTVPVVRQATAVATDTSRREPRATASFPAFANANALDRKRLEIECGPGGDHDLPYSFALPVSTPQLLAWARLQTRVQAGELEP